MSMSDIAIRVDNLSKLYHIGAAERQPQIAWQCRHPRRQLIRVPTFTRSNHVGHRHLRRKPFQTLPFDRVSTLHFDRLSTSDKLSTSDRLNTSLKILSRITAPPPAT